jgi:hypothetical protein
MPECERDSPSKTVRVNYSDSRAVRLSTNAALRSCATVFAREEVETFMHELSQKRIHND